jgi:hypothetical protein
MARAKKKTQAHNAKNLKSREKQGLIQMIINVIRKTSEANSGRRETWVMRRRKVNIFIALFKKCVYRGKQNGKTGEGRGMHASVSPG